MGLSSRTVPDARTEERGNGSRLVTMPSGYRLIDCAFLFGWSLIGNGNVGFFDHAIFQGRLRMRALLVFD